MSGTSVLLLFVLCAALQAQQNPPKDDGSYWPVTGWRTATPESQGLDSRVLASIVERVVKEKLGVHNLLVIRHGYVVLDANFYPYDGSSVHDLASITKSITSTLTGIAVGEGLLKLEQPAVSFFPNEKPSEVSKQKESITIRNLLTMESGLDCGIAPGEQELEQMKRSENWVRFALSLPMKRDPGTLPAYCSPGYHLLGSAVAAAAGMTELEYGRKVLFEPLGIREVIWADDPQGRTHGWGDSHLYPRDLAKIGYLYLHGGRWGGKQIVPAEWVKEATTPAPGDRASHGGFGRLWYAANGKHGLQFGGNGRGGQTLLVLPDLDMIVVSMAGGNNGNIAQMIPDAVKGNAPLPQDTSATVELQHQIAAAGKAPTPEMPTHLPALASQVSGVSYQFPVNPSRIDAIRLTFRDATEAQVGIQYLGKEMTFPVGLDGVYRRGPYGPFHLLAGARGKWTSDQEFLLDLNFIANINHYTFLLRFDGDRVSATVSEASGLVRDKLIVGERKKP